MNENETIKIELLFFYTYTCDPGTLHIYYIKKHNVCFL
jgi:hypothetical protein